MSRLIYLDACIVIYLVEKHPKFEAKILERLERELVNGKELAVSPLVKLEVLAKPLRDGDIALCHAFDVFLSSLTRLSIPDEVYDIALQLRANYRLKVPDALHLAIAQYHECADFWTNGNRLDTAAGQLNIQTLT